jgi:hypothetical protein
MKKKLLGNIISIIIAFLLMGVGGMILYPVGGEKISAGYGTLYMIIVVIPGYYFSKQIILKFLSVIQIKEFENGDKYEGEMKNSKMQGKGIYLFANGEKYEGEFKDDMFEGKGVYFYPDGTKKTGIFKKDELIKETK